MNEKQYMESIKQKPFISMADLKDLLGGSEATTSRTRKFFKEIRKIAVEDLNQKGLIIPARTIIPAVYVWDYLKNYGITK